MYSRASQTRKLNSKQKPLGSGTTSLARKERRAQKFGNVNAQQAEPDWQEPAWQDPDWQEPAWESRAAWESSAAWESKAWHEPAAWESRDDEHEPATSSRLAAALASAPWKVKSEEEDVQAEADAPSSPPIPSKLVAVRAELSSSNSSSDDWGTWKSEKHRRISSEETIQFAGGVLAPPDDALPRVGPKVGIDWLGVVQVYGEIPPENIAALQKLFDHGVEVCVLSWCVESVGQSYLLAAQGLPFFDKFSTFAWTDTRTGPDGKVEHWSNWGCDVIIEKGEDILKEGLSQGMHVFPIVVGDQTHEWWTELGHTPSTSLVHAVDDILKAYFS